MPRLAFKSSDLRVSNEIRASLGSGNLVACSNGPAFLENRVI